MMLSEWSNQRFTVANKDYRAKFYGPGHALVYLPLGSAGNRQ
jgi:hypothetical protein